MPPPSTEQLKLEVEPRGDAMVVRMVGSANMVAAADLKDQLLDLVARGPRRIVLDMSRLAFICSVGLSGIIAAHLRCRRNKGEITVAAPPPDILDLLRVTNLTRLFPVHPSVEAALAAPAA